jgi:hypothetical protein
MRYIMDAGLVLVYFNDNSMSPPISMVLQSYHTNIHNTSAHVIHTISEHQGIMGETLRGEAYKVVALGMPWNWKNIVEIYGSFENSWRIAAQLPQGFTPASWCKSLCHASLVSQVFRSVNHMHISSRKTHQPVNSTTN